MFILTGINLDKISNSDKAINTIIYDETDTIFDIVSYFGRIDNDLPDFTAEELKQNIKKLSSKKLPLIIRLGKHIWSIIEV